MSTKNEYENSDPLGILQGILQGLWTLNQSDSGPLISSHTAPAIDQLLWCICSEQSNRAEFVNSLDRSSFLQDRDFPFWRK